MSSTPSEEQTPTLHLLKGKTHASVYPLLTGLEHQLCAMAVARGDSPGLVYADRASKPTSVLILSPEGSYVAGDAANEDFNAALRQAILDGLLDEHDPSFVVPSRAWRNALPVICKGRRVVIVPRRHYLCTKVGYDWQAAVPDGFSVHPVDEKLLRKRKLQMPDHITRWIKNNWSDRKTFLEHGFGAATVDDAEQQVVSWSVADCVCRKRGEIGIHTAEPYRRKGLATITAAACLTFGFKRGLKEIGWHCNENNIASWRTAERVGHTQNRLYEHSVVMPPEND